MLMCFQMVKKSQQGAGVAVKIEHAAYQTSKMFGRHFDEHDELISHITRASIDILKVSIACRGSTGELQGFDLKLNFSQNRERPARASAYRSYIVLAKQTPAR